MIEMGLVGSKLREEGGVWGGGGPEENGLVYKLTQEPSVGLKDNGRHIVHARPGFWRWSDARPAVWYGKQMEVGNQPFM